MGSVPTNTPEPQDRGPNPTAKFSASSLNAVANPDVDATTPIDFAAQGETDGPLPKSKGLHPAEYALGPGRAD